MLPFGSFVGLNCRSEMSVLIGRPMKFVRNGTKDLLPSGYVAPTSPAKITMAPAIGLPHGHANE